MTESNTLQFKKVSVLYDCKLSIFFTFFKLYQPYMSKKMANKGSATLASLVKKMLA